MPHDPLAGARAALGARQAAVVAAVVDGAPAPTGFAPAALALARDVVAHKRRPPAPRRLRRSLGFALWRWLTRLAALATFRARAASS